MIYYGGSTHEFLKRSLSWKHCVCISNQLKTEIISNHTHTKHGIVFQFLSNKEDAKKTLHSLLS